MMTGYFVVTPPGFEPGTCGLKVRCSAVELEGRAHAVRGQSYRAGRLPCHSVTGRILRAGVPSDERPRRPRRKERVRLHVPRTVALAAGVPRGTRRGRNGAQAAIAQC